VSEILNLRRFRKAKARAEAAEAAAVNRVRFGFSRAEREGAEQKLVLETRRLDGHRLDHDGLGLNQSGGTDEKAGGAAPESKLSPTVKTAADESC
jgi:hypothetical protein